MSKSRISLMLIVVLLSALVVQTFAQTVASKEDEGRLLAVLKSGDASHKSKVDACRQLAIIGGKDSIPVLAGLLADEQLSHMARYALQPNPDPAVDEALREALGKLTGKPLVGVIGTVGFRRDAKAVPALAGRLNDANPVVAQAAARALGGIGTSEAAQALQKVLPKASAETRLDICEGLFRCGEWLCAADKHEEAIAIYDQLRKLDGPHQVRGGALRYAILARGAEGLALLKESLRSDDYIMFSAAVQAAQAMSGGDVTKALTEAMKDMPADNQVLIVQTLGLGRDKAAVPALIAAAQSGAKPVRTAAMAALTEIGDASAVPVLAKALDDGDREVSQAAHDCLATIPGREADAAVMDVFGSGNTDRQLMALDLMGRRRMTDSIPVLLKAITSAAPAVRVASVKMIGELGDTSQLPVLLDLLADLKESQDRAAAEQALMAVCTKAGDSQAQITPLINRLVTAEPSQQAAIVRALGAVGGAQSLQAVRGAVDSDNAEVRSAAIRALGTWKTADAAPYLLALAKQADDPAQRTLCLRGYLGLAARGDLPVEQRLAMCRDAAGIVQRDDEKKLLLGTLGNIESPEAVELIMPYLNDAGTRQEAALAAVTVAGRLLRGRGPSPHAARLIAPLEKVTQAPVSDDIINRAKTLLRQARSKAGN